MKACFWDIESSSLKPDLGVMLCAGIKPLGKNPILLYMGRKGLNDRELCVSLRDELDKYQILIGFYSLGFDLKFLQSRLVYWREQPLRRKLHIDVYRIGKRVCNLDSGSLGALAAFLKITGKNHVDKDIWLRAALEGDTEALEKIVDHCARDVKVLERVFMEGHLCNLINSISLA